MRGRRRNLWIFSRFKQIIWIRHAAMVALAVVAKEALSQTDLAPRCTVQNYKMRCANHTHRRICWGISKSCKFKRMAQFNTENPFEFLCNANGLRSKVSKWNFQGIFEAHSTTICCFNMKRINWIPFSWFRESKNLLNSILASGFSLHKNRNFEASLLSLVQLVSQSHFKCWLFFVSLYVEN